MELAGRNFKEAIINMFKMENAPIRNEELKNLRGEKKETKNEPIGNSRTEKKTNYQNDTRKHRNSEYVVLYSLEIKFVIILSERKF